MEVILREDYLALGYIGDTVKVRRGFARNFLIPRGIAVEASARNERELKHKLSGILSKRLKRKAEAEQFGNVLKQIIVEFTLKIGAQGKSYGSVTARDIEESLKTLGYVVDRRQIRIVDPIRGAGVWQVDVKLHSEVTVPLQVKVIAAQPVAPAVEAGAEGTEKGKGGKKRAKAAKQEESDEAEGEEASE